MPKLAHWLTPCLTLAMTGGVIAITASPISGQEYKMTTPIPPGIASPDTIETRLGTLSFFDGFPDKPTVEKLCDNLEFQRAVQAYPLALLMPPCRSSAVDCRKHAPCRSRNSTASQLGHALPSAPTMPTRLMRSQATFSCCRRRAPLPSYREI